MPDTARRLVIAITIIIALLPGKVASAQDEQQGVFELSYRFTAARSLVAADWGDRLLLGKGDSLLVVERVPDYATRIVASVGLPDTVRTLGIQDDYVLVNGDSVDPRLVNLADLSAPEVTSPGTFCLPNYFCDGIAYRARIDPVDSLSIEVHRPTAEGPVLMSSMPFNNPIR